MRSTPNGLGKVIFGLAVGTGATAFSLAFPEVLQGWGPFLFGGLALSFGVAVYLKWKDWRLFAVAMITIILALFALVLAGVPFTLGTFL